MLKQLAHRMFTSGLNSLTASSGLLSAMLKRPDLIHGINQMQQIQLTLMYKSMVSEGQALPAFADIEFRSYSQNGEDGILLLIFSVIGVTNRKCVEICAGDGIECNSANLIINHGWHGFLFDGSPQNVRRGHKFYHSVKGTHLNPPIFVHAWITRDKINELIRDNGMTGEIDLLTVDLDGVDWHIWRAIDVVQPRVVIVEFNAGWRADEAVTVPYRDDFAMPFDDMGMTYYSGASLAAFVKLGREKGYRLVGVERRGFNAFFVSTGVGDEILPEVEAEACLIERDLENNPRLAKMRAMEWVEV